MNSMSMQEDYDDSEERPYESYQRPNSWIDSFRPPWSRASRSFAETNASEKASIAGAPPDQPELDDTALPRPREPADTDEPAGFFHELDRRIALISVAGRFAAAIGVSAVVALFFVFMLPTLQDYTGQTEAAPSAIQSMKAALNEPTANNEDAKPALCELQNILGAPQTQPAMSHAQSETLLQQFMQWREKPAATKLP